MIELPFVFMAGLMGSAHCIGMCGGFVVSIGATSRSLRENLVKQTLYSGGRAFTYSVLGALAGFGGLRLMNVNAYVPAALAILAGLFLVYQGLVTTQWIRRPTVASKPPCVTGSIFGAMMRGSSKVHSFLAGVMTGFLPCGLLYGMLAGAASTSNPLHGALLMAVFAGGTVPVMILTGCSGGFLSVAARRHLFNVAGWCVIVTGLITLTRGAWVLAYPGETTCPFCP